MKIKLLFFIFCGITFPILLSAQLSKGTWLVNGRFDFTSWKNLDKRFSNNSPQSDVLVLPQVSFFISSRFQVNGELTISLLNKNTIVGQKLGGRFYFNNESNNRFFTGLVLGWARRRSIFATGGFTTQTFQTRLDFGLNHFFNENVALEFLAKYVFLDIIKSQPIEAPIRVNNGGISLRWEMQYFFKSELSNDPANQERNFKRGMWMLGGSATLGNTGVENVSFQIDRSTNYISPLAAYFLNEHWAVGTYFNYSNDLRYRQFNITWSPMIRYYLNLNYKKKIFGEVRLGLGMDIIRINDQWNATNNILRPELKLGVANMLSKYVSLDVWINYQETKTNEFYSLNRKTRQIGVHMGLQAYID